jgi:hypothetical protein
LAVFVGLAYLPVAVHADSLPYLTVGSIWLEDASQPGTPVSQVSSGESFLIVATIKNIGQATASGFYLEVYYDNDYGRGGPDNIAAGEVQTWYVGPLTATNGTHTTKWIVNPDNVIPESNINNNEKDFTSTVGEQAPVTTTTQMTQVVTATGTMNVTSYTTTTVTSYTGTQTSTSTVVVPTTVTVSASASTPTVQTATTLPSTSTVQVTQVLSSTGTKTVTSYITTTVTSYTSTSTSKSTTVVYTTLTSLASAAAPSSLAYLGFVSLFAVTVGERVTGGQGRRTRGAASPRGVLATFSLSSLSPRLVDYCDTIFSRLMSLMQGRCSSN